MVFGALVLQAVAGLCSGDMFGHRGGGGGGDVKEGAGIPVTASQQVFIMPVVSVLLTNSTAIPCNHPLSTTSHLSINPNPNPNPNL
jgi:hypothetical protein